MPIDSIDLQSLSSSLIFWFRFFLPNKDNMLKNSPHTVASITKDNWNHPYSREGAVFPKKWLKEYKYWPPVGRIENAVGDRNLICTCPDISDYEEDN